MNNGISIKKVSSLPGVLEPNSFYQVGTTLYIVDSLGSAQSFTGSPVVGQTTLVTGTKAIAVPGAVAGSFAYVQLVTPANAALTVERQAVCTTDTLTITALVAAHTINAADTSVVNYIVFI